MNPAAAIVRRLLPHLSPLAKLGQRPSGSERAAVGLSRLGTRGLVWVAFAPVLGTLARKGAKETTATVAATTWSADLLALGLRELIGRKRPCHRFSRRPIPCPATPAFPSDHAAMAAAGSTILCRIEPRAAPLLLPLAAGVAYSRYHLGVHHASDVAAGLTLGAACAVAVDLASKRIRGHPADGNETSTDGGE